MRLRTLLCLLTALVCAAASAQEWPSRAVTMVVPFAAGGPLDILGRIVQPSLTEALGQQVIVENVPGAGGVIGSQRVAQAAADAHVFVLGSIGTHAITVSTHRKPPYDPVRDFQPVILVADAPMVLLARQDLPATDMDGFVRYAREHQAKMQYGSAGAGTSAHIACVLLNQTAGIDVVHVPYRGGAPALQDLVAGRIDYMCTYPSSSMAAIRKGQAKIVAPLDISAWNAFFMPKSATPQMVARLNAAARKILDSAPLQKRFDDLGLVVPAPERRSPEYLKQYVESEIARWAAPVKASGVTE